MAQAAAQISEPQVARVAVEAVLLAAQPVQPAAALAAVLEQHALAAAAVVAVPPSEAQVAVAEQRAPEAEAEAVEVEAAEVVQPSAVPVAEQERLSAERPVPPLAVPPDRSTAQPARSRTGAMNSFRLAQQAASSERLRWPSSSEGSTEGVS